MLYCGKYRLIRPPPHHPGRQLEKATQLEGHREATGRTCTCRSELEACRHAVLGPSLHYIIRWLFLNIPWCSFHLFPSLAFQQLLHPCCKTHSPRWDSFAQIHLRRGIASSFLGDAQLSILHPGRLFLMSLSYGLKTSYFEIPLLLKPRSGTNLWTHSFLVLLVIKPLLACRLLEGETKAKMSSPGQCFLKLEVARVFNLGFIRSLPIGFVLGMSFVLQSI